ncbi:MAG: dTDP-4-dehydrorhamnose 3,5-epimerase [Gammaproteobacteria bacterium]|nr:dTDP-4-dehydrorhamnose 3,5-epimerase [Gammaproteobacteria bacterium]MYJ74352.1 dTDP-4-dehydrorhamnose 3,5-epimerase [Gammaproteobacteria bacterium]
MRVEETILPGVIVVRPDVFADDRGFLLETYSKERYDGFDPFGHDFVQDNHSRSRRGVLRGLHFQEREPQGKLVRVSRGRVYDVAVDIDPASTTFRRHVAVILDDVDHAQLFIPPGYAHGFCVLSAVADVEYKCTAHYRPDDARGVLWKDPAIAIRWPLDNPIVSAADAKNPTLDEYLR